MRMSASGLQSISVVAIDQILRLAPSISGPIEPVVSRTNTTSMTGLDHAGFAGRIDSIKVKARKATGAKCLSIDIPSQRRPGPRCSARFASGPRRNCGVPLAVSRKNSHVSHVQRHVRCTANRDKSAAMKVMGKHTRSIWVEGDGVTVGAIDQTVLPHRFATIRLETLQDAARAIVTMQVRGAPLIGATAAYGICLALKADASDESLERAYATLMATRPTAINLKWALDEMMAVVRNRPREERVAAAYRRAAEISDEDVAINQAIGRHGRKLIEAIAARKKPGERVNVLTHCNAGWLATVDVGTALAPVYTAHDAGIPLHVWVDETRPRNQGASLTAWELGQHGVPHTVIPDNAGGHLMQQGEVGIAIDGTGRVGSDGRVETRH